MPAEKVRFTEINKHGEICLNMLKVSGHAYKRARERIHWNRNALNKMSVLAYTNGLRRYELKGRLKHFINELVEDTEKKPQIRIYGEVLYIFRHQTLVTLYQIPSDLRKCLSYHRNTKEQLQ